MRLSALIFFCFAGLAACDTSEGPTPASQFVTEEPGARSLFGQVLQGTEPVSGALVVVDADPNLASNLILPGPDKFARSVSTDPAGAYHLQYAPTRYDLTVLRDRDVFVVRDIESRFFAPALGADVTPRGFTARIVPSISPAPPAGHALAFFTSGPDARTLTPIDSTALLATFRQYDTFITLRVVEYVAAVGLTAAVAEGKVDFRVVDGTTVSPNVGMTPIANKQKVTFAAVPPPGFTLGPLVVEMDLGLRTSAHTVTTALPGVPLEISVVTDARYAVRTVATAKDGATSTSGRHFFGFVPETLELPPPLSVEAPFDDTAPPPAASDSLSPPMLASNGTLSVRFDQGMVEHVLTPVTGTGPILHIATASRATTLPDVTRFGLQRPAGRYTWTVEHFPDYFHPEQFGGEDGRVSPPSWKSAPRIVVIH